MQEVPVFDEPSACFVCCAPPTAAGAGRRKSLDQRSSKGSTLKSNLTFNGDPATFSAFVSHSKADAAMEARFVQMQLEERQEADALPVFLDSGAPAAPPSL